MKVGDVVHESDFATLTPEGNFVQLEHFDNDTNIDTYEVKPGICRIIKNSRRYELQTTSFVNDQILDSFVSTKEITDKIDCFFRNIHIYKEFGIEVPKRGVLLYGPAGSGKSTSITKVAETYDADKKTAIIIWNTDKFEAYEVKDFIKSFEYKDVEKMILIAEDIGGVEIDEVKMKSDSSLLSLLDNKEKTFKIPVLILATTNFPEVFLGNLTNRPDRFDDKIEVGYPNAAYRVALFEFFAKARSNESAKLAIASQRCTKFSPAHIREVVIRSAIYEKDITQVINEIAEEIENFEKSFSKKRQMGF